MQQPSVGRIVHYVQYDGDRCCAAVITAGTAAADKVELHVFPHGDELEHQQDEVSYSEEIVHGTWHWPERV